MIETGAKLAGGCRCGAIRFVATGAPLSYEGGRWPGGVRVLVGAFDEPARFSPQAHVYVAEQMPWRALADGLPRFAKTAGSNAT